MPSVNVTELEHRLKKKLSAPGAALANRSEPRRYRTVWLSDVHLGFAGCSADLLLDFLDNIECERLFLVGDIIDVWAMRRRLYWPQPHNNVVRRVLDMAKRGTEVIYIPGNHDEVLRDYDGLSFGNVRISNQETHTTADGRRLLVLHGDQFDAVVQCSRFLAIVGSQAYGALLRANVLVNWVRRRFNWPYWSLARSIKHRVKNAVSYISDFEQAVARQARNAQVDGVVCGHIHHAEFRRIDDVLYLNCGDWVESCTALIEHDCGDIELLRWADLIHESRRSAAAVPAAA